LEQNLNLKYFQSFKELVEFTNDNAEKVQLLEDKKLEIEQQIQRIKFGEDVKSLKNLKCT
jgi:hypothetical protein